MNIAWSGLADDNYWGHIAQYCVPSWTALPGDKFIVHDAQTVQIPDITVIPWDIVVNDDSNFPKQCLKTKPHGFWRKMQSQVWAVRNLTDYDWLVLLDTDVEIVDFDQIEFERILEEFKDSNLIWATGESQKRKLDAGHIIFNMRHPDLYKLIDTYENIWESGDIFKLERYYDGHAVQSLFDRYPSYKIKNTDHGGGLHTYKIGTVHYGSKIPKALRAVWSGDTKQLVAEMIVDKETMADNFNIQGKR